MSHGHIRHVKGLSLRKTHERGLLSLLEDLELLIGRVLVELRRQDVGWLAHGIHQLPREREL